jgi:LmbE family N-acetylglucosaminyl deacetylase
MAFRNGGQGVESYLRAPITVSIDQLYPDPNNPRLALEDAPGYSDAGPLFDGDTRARIFDELGRDAYSVDSLVQAIVGQGWMPIDNIIVWHHPSVGDRYVVVEGNRRRVALEHIRTTEAEKARRKLERMERRASSYPKAEIDTQKEVVARLERVVKDTNNLQVLPIDADSVEELEHKLPRVLAVRHITGAKEWGNYAEDIWLLNRYYQLFTDKHGDRMDPFWDPSVIGRVSDEASLSTTRAKRQLKAASWFSRFRANWEDQLPEGEEFSKTDYYLFENISRKPWLRLQFGISEEDLTIPVGAEEVLFKWVFRHPRGRTADENPNVFYRHENVLLWDQMKRYDDKHGTGFAGRFDVSNPEDAPTMQEVEAEYLAHKAGRKPSAIIDDLLQRLNDITADKLATEGEILRAQLVQLRDQADMFIKMIDAAEA